MTTFIFTILVLIGVIAVTVLLFGGWVVVMIVKLIARAVNAARQKQTTASRDGRLARALRLA